MSSTGDGSSTDRRAGSALALDLILAASVASWAVLVIVRGQGPIVLRSGLAIVHATVAILLALRRASIANGRARDGLGAVLSMVLGGALLRSVDGAWPVALQAIFVVAACGVALSLAWLGRSFAFLPSVRALVDAGPYRVVRHPAYACELVMAGACTAARPWPGALLLGGLVASIAWRILDEERVLAIDDAYGRYRKIVRYRLLPFVW